MFSSNLLKNANGEKKENSFFESIQIAGIVFGVKDKTQLSILKATSAIPGLPKQKHINYLLEMVSQNDTEFENILINMNSITDWEDSKIVSCKVLTSILLILQNGISCELAKSLEALNFILIKIRDYWASEDVFLSHFSTFLIQKGNFLAENQEFCIHFNINTLSSTGLSLPDFSNKPVLSITSILLCIQDNVISIMSTASKESVLDSTITKTERETYSASLTPLMEEAYSNYIAICKLLEYMMNNSIWSETTWKVFLDQYNNQIIQLQCVCQFMASRNYFNDEQKEPKFIISSKLQGA
jgi:hypothetical protein